MRWDLFVILLTLWNCLFIPYNVAFEDEQVKKNGDGIKVFDYLVDFCFFIDIVLNFRTTYINSKTETEVLDPRRITVHYIFFGRFTIDLLASIPFEVVAKLFIKQNESSSTVFKVFGMLKLFRLLRIGRIISFMKLKSSMRVGFKIFQLLFFLLLLVHWIGCIWFLLV
jgi:hypothetical protein